MQTAILRHYIGFTSTKRLKYTSKNWGEAIPSIGNNLKGLGFKEHIGIPPSIINTKTNTSTKQSLVTIIIEILKELEPAISMQEAMAQTRDVISFVNNQGTKEFKSVAKKKDLDSTEQSFEIGFQAPTINNLPKSIRGLSYVKHLVLFGLNGSIQILKLPSYLEMIEIIKNDEIAQRQILEKQPLVAEAYESEEGLEEFQINKIDELYELLISQSLVRYSPRIFEDGDSDPNRLLRRISFDFPRHIKAGRIKILFDKYGADGLTLWQSEKERFYRNKRVHSKDYKPALPKKV